MTYTDCHRAFAQEILNGRVYSDKDAKALARQYAEHYQVNYGFDEIRKGVNDRLKKWQMSFKSIADDETGQQLWKLVNLDSEDPASQKATTLNPKELAFFERVVQLIVESDTGEVVVKSILDEAKVLDRRMSPSEAQEALDALEINSWVAFSKTRGTYRLGASSMLELGAYLRDRYPNMIAFCFLCKELCIYGNLCPNEACGKKTHKHCLTTYLTHKKLAEAECPNCDTPMDVNARVKAKKRSRGGPLMVGGRKAEANGDNEEEEEEEEEKEEEEEEEKGNDENMDEDDGNTSRRQSSRRSGRRRQARSNLDEGDDNDDEST